MEKKDLEVQSRIAQAYQDRFKSIKKTIIKRKDMGAIKGFVIIIDRIKYTISSNYITSIQVKRIAGITELDEQIAKGVYSEWSDTMGWFAYMMNEDEEPMFEDNEIDMIEHGNEFYTACNGTFLIK